MKTASIHAIYNFLRHSDRLATGGQPSESELAFVAAAGYEVVINLALPDSDYALPNEAECVQRAGMQYVHIPVVWEQPRAEDFVRFARTMDTLKARRLFVHCAANMRVSSFLLLYRVLREGWTYADARADLEKIWLPNSTWSHFIEETLAQAILPARAGDEDAILALLATAGLQTQNPPDMAPTFLSFDGTRVVGSVSLDVCGREAVLRSLAVAPSHRRQGLARALCAFALAHAREVGASDVYAVSETAVDFFAALGFRALPPAKVPATVRAAPGTARCGAAALCLHRSAFDGDDAANADSAL